MLGPRSKQGAQSTNVWQERSSCERDESRRCVGCVAVGLGPRGDPSAIGPLAVAKGERFGCPDTTCLGPDPDQENTPMHGFICQSQKTSVWDEFIHLMNSGGGPSQPPEVQQLAEYNSRLVRFGFILQPVVDDLALGTTSTSISRRIGPVLPVIA